MICISGFQLLVLLDLVNYFPQIRTIFQICFNTKGTGLKCIANIFQGSGVNGLTQKYADIPQKSAE